MHRIPGPTRRRPTPQGTGIGPNARGLTFAVDGYDHDAREIYAIPEVRRFNAAFHRAWPYRLYFCDLNQDALKTMVMCCLPRLTSVARDGRPQVGVEMDPMDPLKFVANDFTPMNKMCERACLPERAIYDRTKAVMEFFGFPFYEPAPE